MEQRRKNGNYTKKPLDFEGVKQVIEQEPDHELRIFAAVVVTCGTRVGEVIQMRMKDILPAEVTVRKVKRRKKAKELNIDKYRLVPKSPWLERILQESLQFLPRKEDDYLFQYGRTGKPITEGAANKRVRKIFAGHDVGGQIPTCHTLLKTATVHIFEKSGNDITAAQQYRGHKNIANTVYYLNRSEVVLRNLYQRAFA